ncbi:MAG TPA: glycosyltransferase family 4 protein, partial [Lacibacter sp.]|nr:glycosyltransferase family 4 protein [Lacibacter sp.]
YYRDYASGNHFQLKELIASVKPDAIFINGLFSLHFNIRPLQYAVAYCKQHTNCKLILSARGMLHPGALSQKSIKKKIFLTFFRLAGWHKAVHWHATDEQELQYIKDQFGPNMNVLVAGNFPNLLPVTTMPEKKINELIMGTVALISPMKNHLAVLQALQKSSASIQWHIYGPVKDAAYWKECEQLMNKLSQNIKVIYHGELSPADLPTAMEQFQLFIMPSKSENFGHALLEALSAGKPVITTNTTPFKHLQDAKSGYTADVNNLDADLFVAITLFAGMNNAAFAEHSKAAAEFAANFVDTNLIKQQYQTLFT